MIDSEVATNPQATGNMRWYVIHAYSGMEKSVKRGLEERIARSGMPEKFGRILVPSEEVVEIKSGTKSVSERRFFPGYVLIEMEMTDESWHLVKNTPKVTGFVGGVRNRPSPISTAEVAKSWIKCRLGWINRSLRPYLRLARSYALKKAHLLISTEISKKSIMRSQDCAFLLQFLAAVPQLNWSSAR